MAKRKRLGGPLQDYLATPGTAPATAAPIARVAGDAAASAAFDEVSRELTEARREGRLVLRLSLDSIEAAWLMRDRTHPGSADDPDFAALLDSLRRNGQRNPIEVVEMGDGRYGLLSGWRRLTALRQLREETGEARFDTVLAFLRQPGSSEEAYVAMVEENEIRLGLTYYERARIAAKSVEAGVFPTSKAALQSLFASASRAKRSKIGSFLGLYQALGEAICFPESLTERVGLALAKVLDADAQAGARLAARLNAARPETFEAEQALLSEFIADETAPAPEPDTPTAPVSSSQPSSKADPDISRGAKSVSDTAKEVCPGVFLTEKSGTLHLSGPAIGPEFRARLEAWLQETADS